MRRDTSERREKDENNKRSKITFSLHEDISETGSRIEINQKTF